MIQDAGCMDIAAFMNTELFSLVILPLLIFSARICDVTLGTLRSICVVRGIRFASLLGFFEIWIWILVIGVVVQNLDSAVNYLAYAGGFATGNFVGMTIGKKMIMGHLVLQVISNKNHYMIINELEKSGYGMTVVDAYGRDGSVKMIFTVIRRERLKDALKTINGIDESAFYSVEEVRRVSKSPSIGADSNTRWLMPLFSLARREK